MNPARVTKRKLPIEGQPVSARLFNYRLVFNKISRIRSGAASANIEPCFDTHVDGLLYQLAYSQAIGVMDPFENCPEDYSREVVVVRLNPVQNGKSELAWTYIANASAIQEGLRPTREYMQHLLASPFMSGEERVRLSKVLCIDG